MEARQAGEVWRNPYSLGARANFEQVQLRATLTLALAHRNRNRNRNITETETETETELRAGLWPLEAELVVAAAQL
jgi:hypothetical protein